MKQGYDLFALRTNCFDKQIFPKSCTVEKLFKQLVRASFIIWTNSSWWNTHIMCKHIFWITVVLCQTNPTLRHRLWLYVPTLFWEVFSSFLWLVFLFSFFFMCGDTHLRSSTNKRWIQTYIITSIASESKTGFSWSISGIQYNLWILGC